MGEKWATDEGTAKYFQWVSVPESKKRKFDGLTVSALGAGTYLGPPDDATDRLYEQTLVQAGLSGVNFFDTAIHYRCQRSERVLKKVLKELSIRGVQREQLAIATKGGYLPSDGSPEKLEDTVRSQYLDTGVIEAKEIAGGVYCMSPAFLENQIASSLKNLGLECIDLYYLHNPELQLMESGEEEFYKKLQAAFFLFEKKVQEKKIRRYGIASWNGFRQKASLKGTLQLGKIIECAKQAGGEGHHFKAVQLPFNLVMLEAIKMKNQIFGSAKKTIAQAAAENKISLMASSPLMQSQVGQLCRKVFEELPSDSSKMLQSLGFVLSTPPFCTAFCGMKKKEHWEENSKALLKPAWTSDVWKRACKSLGVAPE